jgi:hypothetical protein
MNDMVPVVQPAADGLLAVIDRAVRDKDVDVGKLQALLAVKKEYEADEARKAFVAAMNAFKVNPPRIVKNKTVSFDRTSYRHATLDNVCDQIGAALAQHGLSHRWDVQQVEGGVIRVACVLTHALGHSERVQLDGLPDASGSKNKIQQVGSTVTYLQRYTLLSITGLATTDQDDDGAGAGERHEEERPNPWTDELKAVALAAAKKGPKAYGEFWKAQGREFWSAAARTREHADFKALASEA